MDDGPKYEDVMLNFLMEQFKRGSEKILDDYLSARTGGASRGPERDAAAARDSEHSDAARDGGSWLPSSTTAFSAAAVAAVAAAAYKYSSYIEEDKQRGVIERLSERIWKAWNGSVQPTIDRVTGVDQRRASNNMRISRPRRDYSRGATTGLPVRRWKTRVHVPGSGTIDIIHKTPLLTLDVIKAVVDSRQQAQKNLEAARKDIAPHLEDIVRSAEKRQLRLAQSGHSEHLGKIINEVIQDAPHIKAETKNTLKTLAIYADSEKSYRDSLNGIGDRAHDNQRIKVVDGYMDASKMAFTEDRKGFGPNNLDSYASPEMGSVKLTKAALRNDGDTFSKEGLDRAAEALIRGYAAKAGNPSYGLDERPRSRPSLGR